MPELFKESLATLLNDSLRSFPSSSRIVFISFLPLLDVIAEEEEEDEAVEETFCFSSSLFSEHSESSVESGCANQMRKPIKLRKLAKKKICDELNIEKLWKNPTKTLSDFSTRDGWTEDFCS